MPLDRRAQGFRVAETEVSSKSQLCIAWLVCFSVFVALPGGLCIGVGYLCDPSMRNPYAGRMQTACQSGDTRVVQVMLHQGANVSAAVWEYTTALRWVSGCGHLDTVEVFLAAGADVNAPSSHGSILSWAESSNAKDRAKIVLLLKRAGAKE